MRQEADYQRRWPIPSSRTGWLLSREGLGERLDRERDRLFLWLPVAFGIGIGIYFALPSEPPLIAALGVAALAILLVARIAADRLAFFLALAALAASAGFTNAKLTTMRVAAPVIAEETGVVSIAGWVEGFERLADGSARLVLRPATIERLAPEDVPHRVSLRVRVRDASALAGEYVELEAVLMPPPDAAEPGGFDYARQVWFERIGAVGYAVSAPQALPPPEVPTIRDRAASAVEQVRTAIARRIEQSIEGGSGGIASALVTGYRGGIPSDGQEALRAAGLAHILAISGLHMMLVVGTIFWMVRALLALSPRLALTHPIKKWAAATALIGGAVHLVLSGGSIATQRAFIMAAIMLSAVLVDRPAITLRNVAIAAIIVLVLTPEALISASFQMSFAATTALVAAYEALREWQARRAAPNQLEGIARRFFWPYLFGLVTTALIAGLATGPYAAFHFNRVAVYGLIGNVAAMPLVGTLVMPPGLIAMCLMPFGLEEWPLWVMGKGIDAVLAVAHAVAGWEGAVRVVPAFEASALSLMTLGGLWLALWRRGWRLWGLAALAAGIVMAAATPRPDLYVSRDAGMAALRGDDGHLIFVPRTSSRYVAERWLRAAGDPRPLGESSLAEGRLCDPLACNTHSSKLSVALIRHPAAFEEECHRSDVIVTRLVPPEWCARHAQVIGPLESKAFGATAMRVTGAGLAIDTVAGRTGDRPWSRRTGEPPDP